MTPYKVIGSLAAWIAMVTMLVAAQSKPATSNKQQQALADRAAQKLTHLQRNGLQQKPDQTPTVLTDEEMNAYFGDNRVKLPSGVKSVRYQTSPGVITANTQVDFDEIRAGKNSSNPLLSIFTGLHDVEVVAHGSGSGSVARVQIESVAIDGVKVPRFALEMFVDKFIRPKYPQAGLNSQFKMPARVDMAVVGDKKLTLTQK
jgi:hypothetical protein